MGAYNDDGQWRWRKQTRAPDGRRVRESGTPLVNTKRAAELAEAEWLGTIARNEPPSPTEMPTLRAIHADYLKHLEMHRSPSLANNRTSTFKAHLLPSFGAMRLDQITVAKIDAYKAEKSETLEPGTVNNHVVTLTNCLRWAVARWPLRAVPRVEKLPRDETEDIEYLTDDELADLLKSAGDTQLGTMILVAADTGLRIGELLALRWTDVELKPGRQIVVRHNVYKGKDRPPKSKKSRVVPLSNRAHAALKAHQHLRSRLVFCKMSGHPLKYDTTLIHLQALECAGWHVLRHTFGTRLSTKGVPLRAIQEWMGHASIRTTMIYAHFSSELNQAIRVLDGEKWQPGANEKPRGRKSK